MTAKAITGVTARVRVDDLAAAVRVYEALTGAPARHSDGAVFEYVGLGRHEEGNG